MKIPIAKEGYMFIVPLGLLTLLFGALSMTWVTVFFALLFLFVVYFFRDPERVIPTDPKAVVSPADGKVVVITTEKDPFLGKEFTRVSIFLSVFNVHVNRLPVQGQIEKIQYNKGRFMNACNEKASMDNEQNILLIKNGALEVLVKQIAGLIARRIVCWVREGDKISTGQRFGLIRFGSRVDLFVPTDTKLTVSCGDHVQGGKTIMGYLK